MACALEARGRIHVLLVFCKRFLRSSIWQTGLQNVCLHRWWMIQSEAAYEGKICGDYLWQGYSCHWKKLCYQEEENVTGKLREAFTSSVSKGILRKWLWVLELLSLNQELLTLYLFFFFILRISFCKPKTFIGSTNYMKTSIKKSLSGKRRVYHFYDLK